MPFLFVDYDHGNGGEKFCAGLSQASECEKLNFTVYENGRTKVKDCFLQEFLKPIPNAVPKESHTTLYTIVPTHRQTGIAQKILKNVHSLRIKPPQDQRIWNKVVEQRIKKVLLTREPTPEYFLGMVRILNESTTNPNFIRQVKHGMYTIELILLSMGQDPTKENIDRYLSKVYDSRKTEPDICYDLVLAYEELVETPDLVKTKIKNQFGINIIGDWIYDYGQACS